MRVAVLLPVLWSVLLGQCGPFAWRRLDPRVVPAALTVAATVVSMSWLWSCTVLVGLLGAQVPALRPLSKVTGRHTAPLPPVLLAALAAAALILALSLGARLVRRSLHDIRGSRRLMSSAPSDLIVLQDPVPRAWALGGWPGRGQVITTTGMLAALGRPERAVVLAHERAHTTRGHHLLGLVVRAAAALDPLLAAVPGHVNLACERDADETAARAVDDRVLTARTLAAVALLGPPVPPVQARRGRRGPTTRTSLRFTDTMVPARVRALIAPRTVSSRPVLAVLLGLGFIAVCGAVDVAHDADRLLEVLRAR